MKKRFTEKEGGYLQTTCITIRQKDAVTAVGVQMKNYTKAGKNY